MSVWEAVVLAGCLLVRHLTDAAELVRATPFPAHDHPEQHDARVDALTGEEARWALHHIDGAAPDAVDRALAALDRRRAETTTTAPPETETP